ncbi:bifunctional diguanylate cyclase/phosphodiesterase [Verrucosispora sp. WMMA2044]|uniref:Bifunctional diguanylate cyclase/phosphodiesterase n=1 Tax=Verrucosispora sioxanthis TaxID=2499994 RepID=A0A6M1L8F4_9ACTN|nr:MULTISPECIES: bifunctional diguanylate cyclase/phosphodiesterase [Micromonospora]NEE65397.1 bifunctional diguanylate cyclase/phosphodiesterase [Verrucosispora sioxanthis]NGM14507.1 bifunctional diguanylate cyclase/phosphodiesterase [Verrucosispora sioxanthis]WBB49054.1 bifunctional diguanylate cyclase/phosphodiesterase [Verrucosispora sp. WMMA2044]
MTSRVGSPSRRTENAWVITGPLALCAVLFSLLLGLTVRPALGDWPLTLLLTVAMIVAAMPTINVVVRRQALGITFTEIPLVVALYVLPPLSVVLAYTVATLVVQLRRKLLPAKLWFNVALAASATSLATVVYTLLPKPAGVGPGAWAVMLAAVGTHTLVALAAMVAVFTIVQSWQAGRELLRAAPPMLLGVTLNLFIGLLIIIALESTLWAVLLFAGLAIAFALVYDTYTQFIRQHRTLAEMYELTKAITESGSDSTLIDVLLVRIRSLMQAEYATLWLPAQGRHPEVLLSAQEGKPGLLDAALTPATLRDVAVARQETVTLGRGLGGSPEVREALGPNPAKDVIVVPLRSGKAVIGTLEVANRLGDTNFFRAPDVPVFETVAAHAAVALENSRLVDRLRHDAYHDALTKLPNRRRILAALAEAVRIRAPGEVVALLLFDVDRLRQVNEALGHAAGDKVLIEVADRLRGCVPSAALVGRAGGDEFLVTLRLESAEAAVELAGQLREQIRDEMVFDSLTLDVDTAVGVVVHPDHGDAPATLLQRVDVAATAAKAVPGSVQLYTPALESRSLHRLGLAGDLRNALDNGELEVYYQPKVTLRDRRLIGVECLARWEHPTHGAVAPADFVAVAEHTGQLGRLTEFVLREGLRHSRDWAHGGQSLAVAVNLSARTLLDQHFPEQIRDLLAEYGVPAQLLTLEIPEAGVLDGTERPIPTLRRLRDLGVRLSVDDFGTGSSSLAHLRRLPVHEVKVDHSFVQGMATDPGDLAIVNAVVTLSQQFGLTVVAEGVESELTLELLQDIGCEVGQGFLFSRPLPFERLEAWFGAQIDPESISSSELPRLRVVP